MHLFAFDHQQSLVFANEAKKQTDYFCRECGGIVRLRGGVHRQDHFYHLSLTSSCRQNGKSMEHLQIQMRIQQQLAPGDGHLEYRFPQINRIADVVWENRKCIFEVQCSPISFDEVKQRQADYASLGYQVIWILHDAQFNQWRQSAAEHFLEDHPHYYTNIDAEGSGIMYDQFRFVHQGLSRLRLDPLTVDLATPIKYDFISEGENIKMPGTLLKRKMTWPLGFQGDLVSLCQSPTDFIRHYLEEAFQIEHLYFEKKETSPKNFWQTLMAIGKKCFVDPYKIIFHLFLEKSCK